MNSALKKNDQGTKEGQAPIKTGFEHCLFCDGFGCSSPELGYIEECVRCSGSGVVVKKW